MIIVDAKAERHGDFDWLITLTTESLISWLWRHLGFESTVRVRQYIGNCTVWHSYPDFRRQGTLMESTLHDIWAKARHFEYHGK